MTSPPIQHCEVGQGEGLTGLVKDQLQWLSQPTYPEMDNTGVLGRAGHFLAPIKFHSETESVQGAVSIVAALLLLYTSFKTRGGIRNRNIAPLGTPGTQTGKLSGNKGHSSSPGASSHFYLHRQAKPKAISDPAANWGERGAVMETHTTDFWMYTRTQTPSHWIYFPQQWIYSMDLGAKVQQMQAAI